MHWPKVRSTPLQMVMALTANAEPKYNLRRQRKSPGTICCAFRLEATSKSSIDDDRVLFTFMSELQVDGASHGGPLTSRSQENDSGRHWHGVETRCKPCCARAVCHSTREPGQSCKLAGCKLSIDSRGSLRRKDRAAMCKSQTHDAGIASPSAQAFDWSRVVRANSALHCVPLAAMPPRAAAVPGRSKP